MKKIDKKLKKTKIICSIGPVSVKPDVMEQMVLSGMNVARINFSHATIEEREEVVTSVKEVRKRTGANIAILYDTKGPDFRTGLAPEEGIELIEGKTIRIVKEDIMGDSSKITVNYKNALDSIHVGNTVLLEDGLMKLEVVSKEDDGITCKIINGGLLKSRKGMNVPGVELGVPFLSEQDREDIIYACKHEGDFLALSFVNSKENILEVREILKECGREDMKIISKVESNTAISNLEDIVMHSDGVMVARGDLGVEVPMAELPILQKLMIQKCREYGKICIVATEMLASMYTNSRPTRAEVSDISNAVLDGTDAVMLSGETTIGKYPIEAVRYMSEICMEAEKAYDYKKQFGTKREIDITEVIAKGVVESANTLDAKVIVAATMTGYTARKISNLKPNSIILAGCPDEKSANSVALSWGVYPIHVPVFDTTEEVIQECKKKAKEFMSLESGEKVVITGGFPSNKAKHTNLLKIEPID